MPKGESEVAEMAAWLEKLRAKGSFFERHNAMLDRIIARLTASDEPVAWHIVCRDGETFDWTTSAEYAERCRTNHTSPYRPLTVIPLFTHPAPAASEKGREVTEAMVVEAWNRTRITPHGERWKAWNAQQSRTQDWARGFARCLTAAFSAPAGRTP